MAARWRRTQTAEAPMDQRSRHCGPTGRPLCELRVARDDAGILVRARSDSDSVLQCTVRSRAWGASSRVPRERRVSFELAHKRFPLRRRGSLTLHLLTRAHTPAQAPPLILCPRGVRNFHACVHTCSRGRSCPLLGIRVPLSGSDACRALLPPPARQWCASCAEGCDFRRRAPVMAVAACCVPALAA